MVGCHAGVCFRKICYKKKSVPVQTTNCWIILSHCIPFFLEILCHILSSRIASKWQPELRWKSAQKLKKKILVWLQVLRKKSIDKNKIYQKKTLKNNLILFEVKSHSTEIVSFVIKSKLNVFGLTSQSFVGICAAVLEISKQTQKMRLFFRIEVRGIYNNEVLIFFHETTAE